MHIEDKEMLPSCMYAHPEHLQLLAYRIASAVSKVPVT